MAGRPPDERKCVSKKTVDRYIPELDFSEATPLDSGSAQT